MACLRSVSPALIGLAFAVASLIAPLDGFAQQHASGGTASGGASAGASGGAHGGTASGSTRGTSGSGGGRAAGPAGRGSGVGGAWSHPANTNRAAGAHDAAERSSVGTGRMAQAIARQSRFASVPPY